MFFCSTQPVEEEFHNTVTALNFCPSMKPNFITHRGQVRSRTLNITLTQNCTVLFISRPIKIMLKNKIKLQVLFVYVNYSAYVTTLHLYGSRGPLTYLKY